LRAQVQFAAAAQQARGAPTDTKALDRPARGVDQALIARQAEVIVAGEINSAARAERTSAPGGAPALEFQLQFAVEITAVQAKTSAGAA
jgi:hypothetical protein